MEICYSTDVEAFYVTIGQGKIARTVHISDDVLVDLKADGAVHGIELLYTPTLLRDAERTALVGRFPVADEALAAIERLTRRSPPRRGRSGRCRS
jgi:uncharacterized protein YuzE